MKLSENWYDYPPINLPSPVITLLSTPQGLWASGTGGAALYRDGAWEPAFPPVGVTAMATGGEWLFVGGMAGIARSRDGGDNWEFAPDVSGRLPISAMATSPNFEDDQTVLAGTLGRGVLRSDDAGRTWDTANFGLEDLEVTALVWLSNGTLLAATASGIYRSSNEGRAWRGATGAETLAVAALAELPDGRVLAALEEGGLLLSKAGGSRWEPYIEHDIVATTLFAAPDFLLLGTSDQGIFRSLDQGENWEPCYDAYSFAFTLHEDKVYMATAGGVMATADQGLTWKSLPTPPVHDLQHVLVKHDVVVVAGHHTTPMRYTTKWQPLTKAPVPISTMMVAPDGALLAGGPLGLARSTDNGDSWHVVLDEEEAGHLARITFRPDGRGWAGSVDGQHLLTTTDNGQSWQALEAPFGILPLAALQAAPDIVFAATYDARQEVAHLWRSQHDGQRWRREAEARTSWSIVATCDRPPALTLGHLLFLQPPEQEEWQQVAVDGTPIRRVIGNGVVLLVLTVDGLHLSDDFGQNWTTLTLPFAVDDIVDMALEEENLYLLLRGGRLKRNQIVL